jgi:hypothetical protein
LAQQSLSFFLKSIRFGKGLIGSQLQSGHLDLEAVDFFLNLDRLVLQFGSLLTLSGLFPVDGLGAFVVRTENYQKILLTPKMRE